MSFGQTGRTGGRMEGSVHRGTRQVESNGSDSTQAIRSMPRPSRHLRLGALRADEARPQTRKPGLKPVGVSRDLPPDVMAQGEWSSAPNGTRVWRLALTSPGADTLRVRFEDFHAGDGKVWVLGPEENGTPVTIGPYSKDGPFGDGSFWSDIVGADSLVIAYEPPAGALVEAVPFRPVQVSHRFRTGTIKAAPANANTADETDPPAAAAASCAIDVTCHPDYREPASAVALMVFESGGETYQCSGSLISSASQPALPFFLTANHCISNADEARSLITIFNYQTPTCDGAPPRLSTLPRVNGAAFLAGEGMSLGDFTLLQLTAFPNIDVKVLGWLADSLASNERVIAISHPRGDFKRIAFGQRTRDVTIRFDGGERMPANKGYQVNWFQGVTQSGSSGSPLLATVDGKQYVAGTLSAGPDIDEDDSTLVCRTSNLIASYGRFSEALPYLSSFLASPNGGGNTASATATLRATPNPIVPSAGQTTGMTTLSWQASGYSRLQVRVGSPSGPSMTGIEGPTGSAQTGDWVANGMTFYLQDVNTETTIATVTVQVGSAARSGTVTASPNPIVLGPFQRSGSTRITWQATGVTRVQVRVGAPTGPPMTGFEAPSGSVLTGNWVAGGLTFYLQDASDGNSGGAARTIASARVEVR